MILMAKICHHRKTFFRIELSYRQIEMTQLIIMHFVFTRSYKSVYEPYKQLLSLETESKIKRFAQRDRPLREFVKEIDRLLQMVSEIGSLPVLVPMHLFLLDCNHFNKVRFFRSDKIQSDFWRSLNEIISTHMDSQFIITWQCQWLTQWTNIIIAHDE